ncbi:hypothetical protein SAMN04488695_101676 [Proteiniclasticum ruminis]|uniref:Uncharacterized protein n=1 Tax=Proteiniclasticum ruminis TaxID=398199 RepID=A0A1I4YM56_9CLOT|nr:hypothetical protein SAMN04488695_101676 [Proteiniclasticum ruminis]
MELVFANVTHVERFAIIIIFMIIYLKISNNLIKNTNLNTKFVNVMKYLLFASFLA